MSSKYGDEDDDYDFFDSPRQNKGSKNDYSSKNKSQSSSKSEISNHKISRPKSGKRTGPVESTSIPVESDDDYDSDRSKEKNVKKIHAKLPTPSHDDYSDSFDSCSDSENDTSNVNSDKKSQKISNDKNVGHKGQSSGKNKETWVFDASTSKSTSNSKPSRQRHESSGRYSSDSDSYTGSSYSTDSGSVTDVSPLNTPHTPIVGVGRRDTILSKPPKSPMYKDSGSSSHRKSSRPTSGKSRETMEQDSDTDKMDLNLLMQAVLEMDREQEDEAKMKSIAKNRRVWFVPPQEKRKGAAPQPQKNMSFSNDRVRTIDSENQRLMDNILKCARQANEAKRKKTPKPKTQPKLTPSAVNRLKEQRRIEQENQKLLQRLQTAKATKTLRRNDLLHQYDHHLIAGVPVATVHPPAPKSRTTTPMKAVYDFDTSMGPSGSSLRSDSKSSLYGSGRADSGRPSSGKRVRPSSASTTMSSSSHQRPTSGKKKQRPTSAHTGLTKQAGKYEFKTTGPDWEPGW